MIVYGDPARLEPIERSVEILRLMLDQALDADPRPAGLRGLLVRAGELEQGLFDAPDALGPDGRARTRALAGIRHAATCIAAAFDRSYDRAPEGARLALDRARRALKPLRGRKGFAPVAVPEGFAYYALYPESYRDAAIRWARERAGSPAKDVLVVGIRSIGTTLSAVVVAALRAQGFAARRLTVRPSGQPLSRTLDRIRIPRASYGIVVDEGPGVSGSSMLAVTEAMARAGVREISLLSAHDRGPGCQASDAARSAWERCRRYPASDSTLLIDGRTLAEELWSGVRPLVGGSLLRSIDLSGGAWRRLHYESPRVWPAVCRALERPKVLCISDRGDRVLFKFAGIAAAPGFERSLANSTARRAARLAALGFSPRLLGEAHGFVAWDWVEGRPMEARDASPQFLGRMGAYIARASGPALDAAASRAARARIDAMLLANIRECAGMEAHDAAAAELRHVADDPTWPCAGDGHLAPHEWIRSNAGPILKVDVGGHDLDHTWTGPQPVPWDLAGAMEEWDLHGTDEAALLRGYQDGGGATISPGVLRLYRLAYAAHRAGQSSLFAQAESDLEERERLNKSYGQWREGVARSLSVAAAAH
jgi:hypothetical protein